MGCQSFSRSGSADSMKGISISIILWGGRIHNLLTMQLKCSRAKRKTSTVSTMWNKQVEQQPRIYAGCAREERGSCRPSRFSCLRDGRLRLPLPINGLERFSHIISVLYLIVQSFCCSCWRGVVRAPLLIRKVGLAVTSQLASLSGLEMRIFLV